MTPIAAMPQADRVLRVLRQRRGDGVTVIEFRPPDVIDGGAPIERLAARVEELRKRGHRIDTRKGRTRLARYVLIESPAGTKAAAARPPAPSNREVEQARAALAQAEAEEQRQAAAAEARAARDDQAAAGEPLHLFYLA